MTTQPNPERHITSHYLEQGGTPTNTRLYLLHGAEPTTAARLACMPSTTLFISAGLKPLTNSALSAIGSKSGCCNALCGGTSPCCCSGQAIAALLASGSIATGIECSFRTQLSDPVVVAKSCLQPCMKCYGIYQQL